MAPINAFRPFTLVVAAVIRDEEGRVFLTRRPEGSHMGGLWEFPGGKVEDGESPETALERELFEELAVTAGIGPPVTFAIHDEPDRRIILLFFMATLEGAEPRAVEGQAMAWVEPADLEKYPTPPADADLINQLARGGTP